MSDQALKDLNILPETGMEKKVENSVKPVAIESREEATDENHGTRHNVNPTALPSPLNDVGVNNSTETGNLEVEYIESENLTDLQDPNACLDTLLARLGSKEWIVICEALNNVRQLSLHHKEKLSELIGDVIPLVVKSMKNPRSAVCKTSLMTSSDIFKVYNDTIIDLLDPMLVQLLLKASQDKRFVCEAAEAALIAMTASVSPSLLLPKLQPYLKNKNPRIRSKASMCFSKSVPLLGVEGIRDYGIDKLIQTAASQLSDQLPESREAARTLALELQSAYEKSRAPPCQVPEGPEAAVAEEAEEPLGDSWEAFCQTKLPPLSAQAILRVTTSSAS